MVDSASPADKNRATPRMSPALRKKPLLNDVTPHPSAQLPILLVYTVRVRRQAKRSRSLGIAPDIVPPWCGWNTRVTCLGRHSKRLSRNLPVCSEGGIGPCRAGKWTGPWTSGSPGPRSPGAQSASTPPPGPKGRRAVAGVVRAVARVAHGHRLGQRGLRRADAGVALQGDGAGQVSFPRLTGGRYWQPAGRIIVYLE